MKFMKKLTLSLFDKLYIEEERSTTQTWITDTNLRYFMKISLQVSSACHESEKFPPPIAR